MTLLESESRLRIAHSITKSEAIGSLEVMQTLKRRAHSEKPPPIVSDGRSGCAGAMIEVWGQIPPYKGVGPRPKYKAALPGWQHLRVIKKKNAKGRVERLEYRLEFGDDETLALLKQGTVHIERTHLTMRQSNNRLVRKSLGFSKELNMHRCSAAWEDIVYNLVKPLKTLRIPDTSPSKRKWIPQTPAMKAGLSDHCWSFKELLKVIPIPQQYY